MVCYANCDKTSILFKSARYIGALQNVSHCYFYSLENKLILDASNLISRFMNQWDLSLIYYYTASIVLRTISLNGYRCAPIEPNPQTGEGCTLHSGRSQQLIDPRPVLIIASDGLFSRAELCTIPPGGCRRVIVQWLSWKPIATCSSCCRLPVVVHCMGHVSETRSKLGERAK